jgi:opacity protein-like surface antigen
MKKLLISLTFALMIGQLHAQTTDYKKNEIYAHYGVVTVQDFAVIFETLFEEIEGAIINGIIMELGGPGVTWTRETTSTGGAIGLGYNRYLKPRWSVGVLGNYQGFKRTLKFSNGNVASAKDNFYTLMARTDFRWVNKPKFQMYTGVGIGGNYIHSYDTSPGGENLRNTVLAGQLNLLGIRFGRDFGVHLEFGFGWNGLAGAGVSQRW